MSETSDQVATTLTYGDLSFEIASLPASSINKLLKSGLAHFLGNEVASKVSTAKAKRAESDLGPMNDVEIAECKARFLAEAAESLRTGQVTHATRAPRGTAIDTVFNRLVTEKVKFLLNAQGISMPSGDKLVTLPNGATATRADLLERAKARYGEQLRREAEAEIAKRERDAKKSLEASKDSEGMESMGF